MSTSMPHLPHANHATNASSPQVSLRSLLAIRPLFTLSVSQSSLSSSSPSSSSDSCFSTSKSTPPRQTSRPVPSACECRQIPWSRSLWQWWRKRQGKGNALYVWKRWRGRGGEDYYVLQARVPRGLNWQVTIVAGDMLRVTVMLWVVWRGGNGDIQERRRRIWKIELNVLKNLF